MSDATPALLVSVEAAELSASWRSCGALADWLSELSAASAEEPAHEQGRLSAALNELLEQVARLPEGCRATLGVQEDPSTWGISLWLDGPDDAIEAFAERAERLSAGSADYLAALARAAAAPDAAPCPWLALGAELGLRFDRAYSGQDGRVLIQLALPKDRA